VLRGETIRRRGIFPAVDAVINEHTGRYSYGSSKRVFVMWHCDPACPRAHGKDPYDRDNPGFASGYRSDRGTAWTPLDVAGVLARGGQPPSCLCPECIVNLEIADPAAPGAASAPEPGSPAVPATAPAAGPAEDTGIGGSAAAPGGRSARTRFALTLTPPATDADFLDSCARLGDLLAALAGQVSDWAASLTALHLPAAVLDRLHQVSDSVIVARAAATWTAQAFGGEFAGARDVAARGLRFTGQDAT